MFRQRSANELHALRIDRGFPLGESIPADDLSDYETGYNTPDGTVQRGHTTDQYEVT